MTRTTTSTARPNRFAATRRATGPIVVAIGGTDESSALRAAELLALESDAGVLALAVLEPLPVLAMGETFPALPVEFESDRRAALLEDATREVERVVGPDPAWRVRAITGDPARAIADVARDERAALVVMGTGRHRLMDRVFGETALRTIRRASCPVLAVGPGLAGPPRAVVVATDFSPASAWAAESVLPLLGEGATLHFVHVWRPIGIADPRTEALDDEYRHQLPDRFARFTDAITVPPGVTVTHEAREGDAAKRLLEFAEAHDADLIVAGRHGLGAFERILVGSVTTSLLRRATCSVFVAPEPPFAEADRLRRLMTGVSESRTPDDWAAQLDAFTRRNAGRRTALESDLPLLGAETQETGFTFTGASYDPHDRRVELMFGGPGGGSAHLTRGLPGVMSITVLTWPHDADVGLRVDHHDGLTLVRFLPA